MFENDNKDDFIIPPCFPYNRSACLFETGEFKECLEDVETTLASKKYPNRLKRKILNRKLECLKKLKRTLREAEETFEEIKTLAKDSDEVVEDTSLGSDRWHQN